MIARVKLLETENKNVSLIMNDIRANYGKLGEIKVNLKNGPWVCTETVLVL